MNAENDIQKIFSLHSKISYYDVYQCRKEPLLWLTTRNKRPARNGEDATLMIQELTEFPEFENTAELGLLMDQRGSKGVVDPDFERVASSGFHVMLRRFKCASIIVKSQVGALNIRRLTRRETDPSPVFFEVDEAMNYLLTCLEDAKKGV